MKDMHRNQMLRVGWRGLRNYGLGKPLVVSFEVTHSCTCNCRHCDRGGRVFEKDLVDPDGYAELVSIIRPAVLQLSGGEPLLRKDIIDIVKAIRKSNGDLPHIIFVTNASLLNEKNYRELREAGVDRFSVSLDFPDERHDDFRRHPGLFSHLSETVPLLAAADGGKDIAINTAITRNNLPYLLDIARKTEEWGVKISFSAYGVHRTGSRDHFIYSDEDLNLLSEQIERLIEIKKETNGILNSVFCLRRTYEFFRDGFVANCNAGKRFFVVRPNGRFVPCSMIKHTQTFSNQREMVELFTKTNTCDECYVAIRAYSDKTFGNQLKDGISFFFSNLLS